MNRWVIILSCIVLLAGFLRFYKLDTLPPSLEWDEVATGYDANSILKTGRDQFGNFLPLTIRSIDDYKPPLYTYLTAVSIWIWGWNDFAIRFPAALLGTLAILTTFGMNWELFKNKKLALLSALFLAISPWHVNFSRLALETNSTIFFTTFGVWMFLKGLKSGKALILSALLFGLDLYLYHNARVFIPLLGLLLLILYRKELWQQKKYFLLSGLLLSVFVIRLIPIVTSIEGKMRFYGTSIFTEAVPLDTTEKKEMYTSWRTDDVNSGDQIAGKLFHSEKVLFGLTILRNYIMHFNPTFWLFTSDSPRHHVSEGGILYFVDLPLIYIGLYYLFRQKDKKIPFILFTWFLLAPLSAAVTRDTPHSLRSEIFLPTFQIFIALALVTITSLLKNKKNIQIVFIGFVGSFYLFNTSYFMHQYFIHFAKDTSEYWLYGRKEAALFVDSIKSKYDQILVSPSLDHPHVFFLYYLKYDPVKYLREGGTVSGGWAEERNAFDKYKFKSFDYQKMRDGKTLFIGTPNDFSPGITPLKKIQYLNGKEAIWIVAG